jgi:hypothetical protein
MKARLMITTLAVILIALTGFAAYVRLAPSDPTRWNIDPTVQIVGQGWNEVATQTNGASLRIPASDGLLKRLDAIVMATPHTTRLAGSVDQTRITWVTRSALWGFPDYTSAQINADGLYIHARLRFGKSDLGVNAARLNDWLSKL